MKANQPRPTSKAIPEFDLIADNILLELDVVPELLELRDSSGARLTKDRRNELLAQLRAGEVVRIELDAITFRQSKAPRPLSKRDAKHANANFVKFRDGDLARFARGFKGRPMLRDHDRNDLLKRGGTITASEIVETATEFQLKQTLELVKPWAVESALDGTLQTFSIGWDPPSGGRRAVLESIHCTVCECSMFLGDCPHLPGDEHKVESSGQTVIVEAEFRNPRAAEVSGVSFPAVKGTQIESVRQALNQARKLKQPRKETRMNPETLRRLGLPADATPEQVEQKLAELEREAARSRELEVELRASQLSESESKDKLKALELEQRAKALADKESKLAAIKENAVASGLWAPGDDREQLFDDFAKLGVEHAERYAKSLEPRTPVGQPLVARGTAAAVAGNGMVATEFAKGEIGMCLSQTYGAGVLQVNCAEKTFRKMGITPEMFAQFGPHTWELREPDQPWLDDGAGSLEGWC